MGRWAVSDRRQSTVDRPGGSAGAAAFGDRRRALVRSPGRSITRQAGTETLIVPIRGGVADLEAVFTVAGVGSRVWTLLETPRTCEGLVEAILDEYDVTAYEAARDVERFTADLLAAGLIEPAGAAHEPPAR